MPQPPTVSVVVATHDRRSLLARLVHALERQQGAPPFELVVVDDGSTDGTWDDLEHLAAGTAVPMTPVRLDVNRGPAAARNLGWRSARGPLVAFTDDDCVPHPGWLAALTARLDGADVVQGRTLADPAQQDGWPFSYTITVEGEWGYYEACNIGYRRDVLERLGGFDEDFHYDSQAAADVGPIYGEDVDLAWRAKDAGARTAFEPEALVFHDVRRRSFLAHLRDLRRSEGIVLAVARNPRLRQKCHFRWFWMHSHPPAILAAAGLALGATGRTAASRLLGCVLVLPYVHHRTRVMPIGRRRLWLVAIPLALVADLVEVGVFVRASVRYRTLVL